MEVVQLEPFNVKEILHQVCNEIQQKVEHREMHLVKIIEQLSSENEMLLKQTQYHAAESHASKFRLNGRLSSTTRWDRTLAHSGGGKLIPPDHIGFQNSCVGSTTHAPKTGLPQAHDEEDRNLATNPENQRTSTHTIFEQAADEIRPKFEFAFSIPESLTKDFAMLDQMESEKLSAEETELSDAMRQFVVDAPWYILHPVGKIRITWDLLTLPVLVWEMVGNPFLIAFDPQRTVLVVVAQWVTLLFWTLDIVLALFSGYKTSENYIVMDPHRIRSRYLSSWFFPDMIIVGVDWLAQSPLFASLNFAGLIRVFKIVRIFRLIRVFKTATVMETMFDAVCVDSEFAIIVFNIMKYILVICAINHLIACLWFYVGRHGGEPHVGWVYAYKITHRSLLYKYLVSLHWSLTQFTPASMSVQPQNTTERLIAVVVLLFALCVFSSFISSITSAMTNLRALSARRQMLNNSLRRYLHHNGISQELGVRISRYMNVVAPLQAKYNSMKNAHILDKLPETLKTKLHLELFGPQLEVNMFFYRLKVKCLSTFESICDKAIRAKFCPRFDIIFLVGDRAHSMYFVFDGELHYHRQHAEQHFNDMLNVGEWASEPALWTKWVHVGSLRATKDSEVCQVSSAGFEKVVQDHPEHRQLVLNYGRDLLAALNEAVHYNGREALTDLSSRAGGMKEPAGRFMKRANVVQADLTRRRAEEDKVANVVGILLKFREAAG